MLVHDLVGKSVGWSAAAKAAKLAVVTAGKLVVMMVVVTVDWWGTRLVGDWVGMLVFDLVEN